MAKSREAHSRSLAKAISWRVTGTLDTFVISYIITGQVGAWVITSRPAM